MDWRRRPGRPVAVDSDNAAVPGVAAAAGASEQSDGTAQGSMLVQPSSRGGKVRAAPAVKSDGTAMLLRPDREASALQAKAEAAADSSAADPTPSAPAEGSMLVSPPAARASGPTTAAGAAEDTEGKGDEEPIIKRTAKWPKMKDVKARLQAEEDSP